MLTDQEMKLLKTLEEYSALVEGLLVETECDPNLGEHSLEAKSLRKRLLSIEETIAIVNGWG